MGGIRPSSNGRDLFRIAILVAVAGCGAGDNRLDPGELELRDLLGIAPEAASRWDAEQRASARRVLEAGLAETAGPVELALAGGDSPDDRVSRTLVLHDAERADAGDGALGLLRVELAGDQLIAKPLV